MKYQKRRSQLTVSERNLTIVFDKEELGCATIDPLKMKHNEIINISLYPSGSLDVEVRMIGVQDIQEERMNYIKKNNDPFTGFPISFPVMGDPFDFLLIEYPEKHKLTQEQLKKVFE